MLSPEAGQMWFRIAFFIVALSAVLLFFQEPGSASFVFTVLSLVIGVIFVIILAILVRRSQK